LAIARRVIEDGLTDPAQAGIARHPRACLETAQVRNLVQQQRDDRFVPSVRRCVGTVRAQVFQQGQQQCARLDAAQVREHAGWSRFEAQFPKDGVLAAFQPIGGACRQPGRALWRERQLDVARFQCDRA
jgi:hypothetical protein